MSCVSGTPSVTRRAGGRNSDRRSLDRSFCRGVKPLLCLKPRARSAIPVQLDSPWPQPVTNGTWFHSAAGSRRTPGARVSRTRHPPSPSLRRTGHTPQPGRQSLKSFNHGFHGYTRIYPNRVDLITESTEPIHVSLLALCGIPAPSVLPCLGPVQNPSLQIRVIRGQTLVLLFAHDIFLGVVRAVR